MRIWTKWTESKCSELTTIVWAESFRAGWCRAGSWPDHADKHYFHHRRRNASPPTYLVDCLWLKPARQSVTHRLVGDYLHVPSLAPLYGSWLTVCDSFPARSLTHLLHHHSARLRSVEITDQPSSPAAFLRHDITKICPVEWKTASVVSKVTR